MPKSMHIPGAPAELMAIINRHQARIPVGLTMMADPDPKADPADDPKVEPGKDPADKPLGPAGESALKKERDRADSLDKQVKALQGQMGALASALGVDAKDDKGDLTGELAKLTLRLDVSELARTHGISDAEDIASLQSIQDPEVRARLAARLAPKADDGKDEKADGKEVFPRPKPDGTQGPKGDSTTDDPAPGMARIRAAYAATNKN